MYAKDDNTALRISLSGLVCQQIDKKPREIIHQGDFKGHFNSLGGFFPLQCISLPLFGNQGAKTLLRQNTSKNHKKSKKNRKYLEKKHNETSLKI